MPKSRDIRAKMPSPKVILNAFLPVTVKKLNSYKNTRDLQGMGTVVCEKKRAIASDMETAVLFVLGSLRGVRTASILNVVAASQSSVAEDIGKYAAKEAISMSGEEREILTALEAFTRIQK